MNKYFAGIDIGTSSLKALAFLDNDRIFIKKTYKGNKPSDYVDIVKEVIGELITKTNNNIESIAFSSQTGTYVIDDEILIKWNDDKGSEELNEVQKKIKQKVFLNEIQMKHPSLISYPIPRLLYVKKNLKDSKKVCQLKDHIIEKLTGNYATDFYTWRGLYNFNKKDYSRKLLQKFNLDYNLPKIYSPDEVVGEYKGIKILVGLNDFYSGLIGIGALNPNAYFDITGTSEHVGFVSSKLSEKSQISSRFLDYFVSYGVTQSSGTSLNFVYNFANKNNASLDNLKNNPPVFLPYLNGERAPIYDMNARGVFFGINSNCTKDDLAYSVYEGISFTLLDILDQKNIEKIIVTGGAVNVSILNEIKANLLDCKILVPNETESSAYGAYLIAKHGLNISNILNEIKYNELVINKNNEIKNELLKRFEMFRKIYKTNKNNFKEMKELNL